MISAITFLALSASPDVKLYCGDTLDNSPYNQYYGISKIDLTHITSNGDDLWTYKIYCGKIKSYKNECKDLYSSISFGENSIKMQKFDGPNENIIYPFGFYAKSECIDSTRNPRYIHNFYGKPWLSTQVPITQVPTITPIPTTPIPTTPIPVVEVPVIPIPTASILERSSLFDNKQILISIVLVIIAISIAICTLCFCYTTKVGEEESVKFSYNLII